MFERNVGEMLTDEKFFFHYLIKLQLFWARKIPLCLSLEKQPSDTSHLFPRRESFQLNGRLPSITMDTKDSPPKNSSIRSSSAVCSLNNVSLHYYEDTNL